jgi:hypothetical protein
MIIMTQSNNNIDNNLINYYNKYILDIVDIVLKSYNDKNNIIGTIAKIRIYFI